MIQASDMENLQHPVLSFDGQGNRIRSLRRMNDKYCGTIQIFNTGVKVVNLNSFELYRFLVISFIFLAFSISHPL